MNKKIELTNTYVDCRSWSVEDKIKYMKLCIGNDLPHNKICGWASYSLDSLMGIYSKCTFIYFDGSMLSQDQCETPVLISGRNLVSLDEILRAAALEEKDNTPSIHPDSEFYKKPRTKVEYVKCEFDSAWEAVKDFEGGKKLYTKRSHKDYILIDNAPDVLRFLYDLHERHETPMTEREAFVEAAIHELKSGMSDIDYAKALFDSGKFKLVN
jgi:hypothetical protein